MKRFVFPIIGIAILIATVAQVHAMRVTRNAALKPHLAAAPRRIVVEGRLVTYPGHEVTVGSDASGTIERLSVNERDVVRKGDVIAIIRADDTRAALNEAKARVAEAEADIRLYELDSDRAKKLWQEAVGSKQAWEKSERDLDAARARRMSHVAEVQRLEATLAKSVVKAPIDGVIVERLTHAGEMIASGAPIVTIADLGKTRIEAEVDEFDAGRVRNGAEATITAEGFDGRQWRGTIEEIPDAVTSRRLKPLDASKPIDTRVLLVKIALREATPLKLGQRVEVQIAE
jgi:RND family efflux transporter MFP subunit